MSIDWSQAFLAGVAGALIAAVAAVAGLLYRSLAPRMGRLPAALTSAGVIVALGVAAAYSPLGRMAAASFSRQRELGRLSRVMAAHMGPLLESPDFQRRVASLSREEARTLGFQLASEGILRLSDEQLVTRTHLIGEAVAVADEEVCAAQLLGPTPEQARQLLSGLSDASLERWAGISAEASLASLREAPRRVPGPSEIREGFQRLLGALPPDEARRLAGALQDPGSLGSPEACWSVRAIYAGFASLPPDEQARTARILALQ